MKEIFSEIFYKIAALTRLQIGDLLEKKIISSHLFLSNHHNEVSDPIDASLRYVLSNRGSFRQARSGQ